MTDVWEMQILEFPIKVVVLLSDLIIVKHLKNWVLTTDVPFICMSWFPILELWYL